MVVPLVPLALGGANTSGGAALGAGASAFPVGLVAFGAMLVYSIATRPNGKDRRSPGGGFALRENPTDPNEPMGLGYGMPTIVPPTLCRFLKRSALNSLAYQPDEQDVFTWIGSLGGGPIDGRDLMVWLNDEPLFEKTESDAPDDETTLVQVDEDGKRFRFPKRNVVVDSVALFRDGTYIGSNESGGGIGDTVETTISAQQVSPRKFYGDSPDPEFFTAGEIRYGAYIPLDTSQQSVRDLVVDVVPKQGKSIRLYPKPTTSGFFFGGFGNGIISARDTVPTDHVHLSTATDGKAYFWIGVDTTGTYSGDNIAQFIVSFRAKPRIQIVLEPDGQAYAVFETSQTGHTIKATYKTSTVTDGNGRSLVELILRTGESDQEPLPTEDGIRNTAIVGAELGQGDSSIFETVNEVHDVEVGIASGSEGFVDVATTGTNAGDTRPATRRLQIRLKHRDAPNEDATGTDLSTGWVVLKHPARQDSTFPVTGTVNGQARWAFSVAELYAFTRDGKTSAGYSLPLAKYDVEVRALDVPGNRDGDNRTHASIQSRIFFDNATEVVRIRLTLPFHATLTVRVKDAKLLQEEPVFSVRCGMRRVVAPADDAEVLDLGDGYRPWERVGGVRIPSPRRWSRNPIWCAADIVTDPWFGAGQWYTWQSISLSGDASAGEAADWCDSTDPGETMAELDIWLNRRSAILDHVAQMLAGARVLPTLTGGSWEFPIDRDAEPSMTLTDKDFERDAQPRHVALEQVPTEIEAAYLDDDLGGELAPRTVSLPSQDPRRRVLRRVSMVGVRRVSQLDRVLRFHLAQFQLQKDALDGVGSNWRLLRLRAGRIVRVTNSDAGWVDQLCRVMYVVWGSDLKAAVALTVHDPAAEAWQQFKGPSGGVPPATRPPSDTVPSGSASGGGSTTGAAVTGWQGAAQQAQIQVVQEIVFSSFKASKVSTLEA